MQKKRIPKPSGDVSKQRQNELALRAKAGDPRAAAELIPTLMGLAHQFTGAMRAAGVPRDEIFSAAYHGIADAIRAFDPEKGDISSVAEFRIRARLYDQARFVSGRGIMKQSRESKAIIYRSGAIIAELEGLGLTRAQAIEVAALELECEPMEIQVFLEAKNSVGIGPEKKDFDDSMTIEPVETGPDQIAVTAAGEAVGILRELLDDLEDLERVTIERRWLSPDSEKISLDRLAEELGHPNREKLRRAEKRGMAKMKKALEDRGLSISDLL